jgi:hypothetical protein
LIQPNTDLSKLQKFKTKYGWKVVEIRNNFFIGTSPGSKWILDKISGKLYGLKFNGISLENIGTSEFYKNWLISSSLHLVSKKNKFQANMFQKFDVSFKL